MQYFHFLQNELNFEAQNPISWIYLNKQLLDKDQN